MIPTTIAPVTNELAKYGIKPELENTGKGHILIRWVNHKGVGRTVTVAKTPSDGRGNLNSRAQVRRMLKADGQPKPNPKTLAHALQTPVVMHPVTPHDRITKLEEDVACLIDMLGERPSLSLSDVKITFGDKTYQLVEETHVPVPEAPVVTEPVKAATPHPIKSKTKGSELLSVISFIAWMTPNDIAKAAGMKPSTCYVALDRLKIKGLVEHMHRVGWRRIPLAKVKS